MSNPKTNCKIILALDLEEKQELEQIVEKIGSNLEWVKIGLQLFTKYGPEIINIFANKGYKIFLDLKLHDIPNTVASAIKSLKDYPIHMLTIHGSGGREMLTAAVDAANSTNPDLELLAVTVLTSFDQQSLNEIGVLKNTEEQVSNLAQLAIDSKVPGLVCSPLELPLLRKQLGESPTLVTPGIRPKGSDSQEQKRIMTPLEAAQNKSSYIVIGRPILRAEDPAEAFQSIHQEIQI